MNENQMDQAKYLERIGYRGMLSPTLEVLKELQQKHLFNIPFENLDIHYGNRIDLESEKIYDKIINRNRGGFCYELNSLFYDLLISIGFNAKMVSARVHEKEDKYSPEFDHMAIIVCIDETEYLVDVGFGEFTFSPIKIDIGAEQNDLREVYRIENYDERYFQVSKKDNDKWIPKYIFDPKGRELSEFEPRCNFHQTSSESHFQQKKVCSLPIPKGRLTVSSDKVKIKLGNEFEEHKLTSEEEFQDALWKHFKINIT